MKSWSFMQILLVRLGRLSVGVLVMLGVFGLSIPAPLVMRPAHAEQAQARPHLQTDNILVNGGFEQDEAWDMDEHVSYTSDKAHSGKRSATTAPGVNTYLYQVVDVPEATDSLTLHFYWKNENPDTVRTTDKARGTTDTQDTEGSTTQALVPTGPLARLAQTATEDETLHADVLQVNITDTDFETWYSDNLFLASNEPGWHRAILEVDSDAIEHIRGQQLSVNFLVYQDNMAPHATFYVDDVQLLVNEDDTDAPPEREQPATVWSSVESDDTRSLAWGDVDNDGDLDLAVANYGYIDSSLTINQSNRVYINESGVLSTTAAWSSSEQDTSQSLAWGDVDNDGDLDLAVGNAKEPNRLYLNDGGMLQAEAAWSSHKPGNTWSVAWGDIDGDGDLDLVVGTIGTPNLLYRNEGGTLSQKPVWASEEKDQTTSVALGDVDNDGDLDLVAGNYNRPNRLYRNEGGTLTSAAVWSSFDYADSDSVALGDMDGDGDLDLAVGNANQPVQIYRNDDGLFSDVAIWSSYAHEYTWSVAWGDVNGDGKLDLVVGNSDQRNRVYFNKGKILDNDDSWVSTEDEYTWSVALGDMDGDGDLDLATGNRDQPVRVHRFNTDALNTTLDWASDEETNTSSVAWGNVDGDGDLDLATGNYAESNDVYYNEGGTLARFPDWWSEESDLTRDIAWGDVDGDGDLDLAVGNYGEPNRLYRNDDGMLTTQAVWSSDEADSTHKIAWGDYDGDGDLDLAVANSNQPNRLYRNDDGTLTSAAVWETQDSSDSWGLAWGDYDGDGDLDLAVANNKQPNRLYRNNDGELETKAVWSSLEEFWAHNVAWGDYDGDGDLDMAAANWDQPIQLYRNDHGTLTDYAIWSSLEAERTTDLAWGDADGDGDLDLVVANCDHSDRMYRNNGGSLTEYADWSSDETTCSRAVAWGDVDGDGDLDLASGKSNDYNHLYFNTRDNRKNKAAPPAVVITHVGPTDAAYGYASERWQAPVVVPIQFRLFETGNIPIERVQGFYSLNGGGTWLPALTQAGAGSARLEALEAAGVPTTTDTAPEHPPRAQQAGDTALFLPTIHVPSAPPPRSKDGTYTYQWDTWASGFFGQSDDVMFRLVAVPALAPTPNSAAGPYQYSAYATTSFPLRMISNQIQVTHNGTPVDIAHVQHIPQGEQYASVLANNAGEPLRTNQHGYLQGNSQVALGDTLVALLPYQETDGAVIYLTNATPITTGLVADTVNQQGNQILEVSESHQLTLFNLDVSLEWDARADEQFLARLKYDLRRVSEILYDWTNGQVALGNITIYHDRENWNYAHIRIYATNRLRPNANQGGIITEAVGDPTRPFVYEPGQVRIGAVWNRYGEANGTMGEDWPRTLAHELGHYALFLDDNYIGLDDAGRLIPVTTCPGAMSDPYLDNTSEFQPPTDWLPGCAQTLSNQGTGRSDWETITAFYPNMHMPSAFDANPGPGYLPLDLTTFTVVEPETPVEVLDVPIFYMVDEQGRPYQPEKNARVFLFQQEGDYLIDLGTTILDRVEGRGARPGDRLCVFTLAEQRRGCETVRSNDQYITMAMLDSSWRPDVVVTPIDAETISVMVEQVPPGLSLKAQLYPVNDTAQPVISLTANGAGYSGQIRLDEPAFEGLVHVWVDEPEPRRAVMSDYAIGGNPGSHRKRNTPGGNPGSHRKRNAPFGTPGSHRKRNAPRGNPGSHRKRNAPVLSSDGQAMLFGSNLTFNEGEFYAIQSVSSIEPPAWATVVGQGYRLTATARAPQLEGNASLSISYMTSDVVPGEEEWISVYFQERDPEQCGVWEAPCWRPLPTNLNTEQNTASAPAQGTGRYALMSSVQVPLKGPGWNNIAYPVRGSRTMSETLQSIEGYYTSVWHYNQQTATPDSLWQAWQGYHSATPSWVNTLAAATFGQGYWVYVTQDVTLYLKGATEEYDRLASSDLAIVPAIYYGDIQAGNGFVPAAGQTVQASMQGNVCGEGQTRKVNGNVVYAVTVVAAGCGVPGDTVSFTVDGQAMSTTATWDNTQANALVLRP